MIGIIKISLLLPDLKNKADWFIDDFIQWIFVVDDVFIQLYNFYWFIVVKYF